MHEARIGELGNSGVRPQSMRILGVGFRQPELPEFPNPGFLIHKNSETPLKNRKRHSQEDHEATARALSRLSAGVHPISLAARSETPERFDAILLLSVSI